MTNIALGPETRLLESMVSFYFNGGDEIRGLVCPARGIVLRFYVSCSVRAVLSPNITVTAL